MDSHCPCQIEHNPDFEKCENYDCLLLYKKYYGRKLCYDFSHFKKYLPKIIPYHDPNKIYDFFADEDGGYGYGYLYHEGYNIRQLKLLHIFIKNGMCIDSTIFDNIKHSEIKLSPTFLIKIIHVYDEKLSTRDILYMYYRKKENFTHQVITALVAKNSLAVCVTRDETFNDIINSIKWNKKDHYLWPTDEKRNIMLCLMIKIDLQNALQKV